MWGDAKDYASIQENISSYITTHQNFFDDTFPVDKEWSFKIKVDGFGRKYPIEQQKEMMLNFSFMDLLQVGKVDLSNPDHIFWVIEDVGENMSKETPPKRVMFTRQVGEDY